MAPLASEAPELLVAGLYAWHLNTTNGLSTLVSSKINQWTLLVGTLPLVFAVAVLVNLTLNVREAVALTGLFLVQFALAALVPGAGELLALSVVYLVLAAAMLRARHRLGLLVRDSLRTPYRQLTAQPDQGPAPGSST